MEREQIKSRGTDPLNGNDAYAVLAIVFDFIGEVEQNTPLIEPNMGSTDELLDRLRDAGYCCCTTRFGCKACN